MNLFRGDRKHAHGIRALLQSFTQNGRLVEVGYYKHPDQRDLE